MAKDIGEVVLKWPVLSTVHYGGPGWTVDSTVFEMSIAL